MRFGLSAKSFADISDLFRVSPKCLADNSAFIDMSSDRSAYKSTIVVISSDRSADKSTIIVISSDRSADNSTAFGMFKNIFADKSITFGVFKKMFADKSIAFGVSKKMFADNSDAFGMSLNRILLLQTFRSKYLFRVFADAYLFYHQFFHGFKNPRLFALSGFPSFRRLNVHRSSFNAQRSPLTTHHSLLIALHMPEKRGSCRRPLWCIAGAGCGSVCLATVGRSRRGGIAVRQS